MESNILRITFFNHLNNLKWVFFSSSIYYSFIYFIFGGNFFTIKNNALLIAHLWVVISLIIVFYIHITYFFENTKIKLKIEKTYILDLLNDKKIFSSDIYKIIICKSYTLTVGRIPFFPFQHYKYCEVILKDGEKIILTSLLKSNIDEYLKENLKGVVFENNFSPFSYFLS